MNFIFETLIPLDTRLNTGFVITTYAQCCHMTTQQTPLLSYATASVPFEIGTLGLIRGPGLIWSTPLVHSLLQLFLISFVYSYVNVFQKKLINKNIDIERPTYCTTGRTQRSPGNILTFQLNSFSSVLSVLLET